MTASEQRGRRVCRYGTGKDARAFSLELEVLVMYPNGDAPNPVARPEGRRESPAWRCASRGRERGAGVVESEAPSVIKASR